MKTGVVRVMLLSLCSIFLFVLPDVGRADDAIAAQESLTPAGGLTVGQGGNDQEAFAYIDALVRLWGSGVDLFFVAPRLSASDASEEEVNVGLGYRHLFSDAGVILGGNVYYDSRWSSRNNRFDQIGAGLEVLSQWVDARMNYYWPDDDQKMIDEATASEITVQQSAAWGDIYAERNGIYQDYRHERIETTTTRLYRRYEGALEGYDCEIGIKLPGLQHLGEARLFVGYQEFDDLEGRRLNGAKGRAELFFFPGLIFDAEYFESTDLNGSDFYVGARVNLPFDLSRIAQGENPFAGTTEAFGLSGERTMQQRLDEMVRRDPKIQTATTDWQELPEKQAVTTERTAEAIQTTLLDKVTFVSGDNDSGCEDGTCENPYASASNGVANGNSPVYIQAASEKYIDNIVLPEGVDLYGAGAVIHGQGGKTFGGETPPIVEARTADPTITIAGNNVTVAGLDIRNPHSPTLPSAASGSGIYANGVTDIEIRDNIISASNNGIALEGAGMNGFTARIVDNRIQDAGSDGLRVAVGGNGGAFDVEVSGQFENNGITGVRLYTIDHTTRFGTALLNVHDVVSSGNGEDGLDIYTETDGPLTMTLANLVATQNADDGIREIHLVTRADAAPVDVSLVNVQTDANSDDGFEGVDITTHGYNSAVTLAVNASQANGNGDDGFVEFEVDTYWNDSPIAVSLASVGASNNGETGLGGIDVESRRGDSPVTVTLTDVEVAGNADNGIDVIYAETHGADSEVVVSLHNVNASDNVKGGVERIDARVAGSNSSFNVMITDSSFNRNGQGGIALDSTGRGSFRMTGSSVISNGQNGIWIDAPSGGPVTYNFGDAAAGTAGGNSLYGNGLAEIGVGATGTPVKAENNWWGADQDPVVSGQVPVSVDAAPRLASDPN